MIRTVACAALAAVFALTVGCSSLRSLSGASSKQNAGAKSQKDVAACEKMCEVAGDAEANKSAVSNCKKDCRG